MQIRIVAGSNAAIYKQIADQINRAVASGDYVFVHTSLSVA